MYMRLLQQSLRLLALFTVLLGFAYPAAVTAVARLAFPAQAAGSLALRDGQVVGSHLIGQVFSDNRYFWGRPSATGARPYDAMASSGSNLGPLNPDLLSTVRARIVVLRTADPLHRSAVPVDLVTASGSGLDPDISLAAAQWQVPRVAAARGLPPAAIDQVVARLGRRPLLGFIGEPRINVLELNLALDAQP